MLAGMTTDQMMTAAIILSMTTTMTVGEGRTMLDTLMQDVRYAGRSLRRNPGFTTAAVLVLALAMPADAANNKKPRKAQIKVMSYNLYVGADIFRVFTPTPCGVPQAVNDVHTIIQQTDIPERAEAIARAVVDLDPLASGWRHCRGQLRWHGCLARGLRRAASNDHSA